MRVLVTGGAGFIGSHFVKRLAAGRRRGRRARQAHLRGQPARTSKASRVEFVEGDIADPEAVARGRGRAARRSSTSPPRRTSTARSSARPSSSTPTCSARTSCSSWARGTRRPARPGLDRRGLRRRLEAGGSSREDDPLRPSSPYAARRPAATSRCSRTCAPSASTPAITRGSNTYGPNQYPEKLIPLFVTNALDGEPLPRLRRRPPGARLAPRRGPLRRGRARPARGRAGEVYNVGGGSEHENIEVARRILELTGADPALVRHVDDRPGHDRRYSLDDSKLRDARLGAGSALRGRPRRDGRLVPRQPRLVGADQVGRVPRVLRAAVRRPPR